MASFSQHQVNTCHPPGSGPGLRDTTSEQVLTPLPGSLRQMCVLALMGHSESLLQPLLKVMALHST